MRWTWTDCIVGMVLVVALGGFALAQILDQEETVRRIKCASNLRQIGQAMLLYSNDNRGAHPRTIANMDDPKPVWGTPYQGNDKLGAMKEADPFHPEKSPVAPSPNDVTAALWVLLRTQDITSDIFLCPSSGNEKWDYGGGANTPMNWTNWPGKEALAAHLSYSLQNPYVTKEAIGKGFKWNNTLGAEFAVAADMNPGGDALLKLTPRSSAREMTRGNSVNHMSDGQNILYGDGHVAWEANPFVGFDRDNIYTFGGGEIARRREKGGGGIVGSSVDADDSILLPTSKDLGVIDAEGNLSEEALKRRKGISPDLREGTVQEQEAARQRIMGTYVADKGPRRVTLQITRDKMIAAQGPLTVTFDYKLDGLGENVVRLELTAPDTPPAYAKLTIDADALTIRGTGYFEGTWRKTP